MPRHEGSMSLIVYIHRVIFGKIDTNNDKHVTHEELKAWVVQVSQK